MHLVGLIYLNSSESLKEMWHCFVMTQKAPVSIRTCLSSDAVFRRVS